MPHRPRDRGFRQQLPPEPRQAECSPVPMFRRSTRQNDSLGASSLLGKRSPPSVVSTPEAIAESEQGQSTNEEVAEASSSVGASNCTKPAEFAIEPGDAGQSRATRAGSRSMARQSLSPMRRPRSSSLSLIGSQVDQARNARRDGGRPLHGEGWHRRSLGPAEAAVRRSEGVGARTLNAWTVARRLDHLLYRPWHSRNAAHSSGTYRLVPGPRGDQVFEHFNRLGQPAFPARSSGL